VNEWNDKAAKFMLYKKEEVMGRNLVDDIIVAEYQGTVRQALNGACQGKNISDVEVMMVTKMQDRVSVCNTNKQYRGHGVPIDRALRCVKRYSVDRHKHVYRYHYQSTLPL
jgi:hypothetical protein